jgi:hypothetical protein
MRLTQSYHTRALVPMMLGYAPAWALGDAGELAAFPVLIGVESITILVDHDLSGTGQQAALRCSARWTSAGREIFRLVPRQPGADVNDLLKCGGGARKPRPRPIRRAPRCRPNVQVVAEVPALEKIKNSKC